MPTRLRRQYPCTKLTVCLFDFELTLYNIIFTESKRIVRQTYLVLRQFPIWREKTCAIDTKKALLSSWRYFHMGRCTRYYYSDRILYYRCILIWSTFSYYIRRKRNDFGFEWMTWMRNFDDWMKSKWLIRLFLHLLNE